MPIIVPECGEEKLLDLLRDDWVTSIHLYVGSVTLDSATTVGAFTAPTWSGYEPIALTGWTSCASDGDGRWFTSADQVTFTVGTVTTPENVYGWYVSWPTTGVLLYCEEFPGGPINVTTAGQEIKITVNFTLRQEAP